MSRSPVQIRREALEGATEVVPFALPSFAQRCMDDPTGWGAFVCQRNHSEGPLSLLPMERTTAAVDLIRIIGLQNGG